MPFLRNPKHEKFAQLVASGMTAQAAFTQAGYSSPQNAPRLRNNELVAKRIEELQARNERKAEMAAMTRDDLIKILAETVHAARSRLSDTRLADGLKAAELLTKLCGWNEPEKREERHLHAHMQVDKALLAQLRAGFIELQGASARMKMLQGADTPRHPTPPVPPEGKIAGVEVPDHLIPVWCIKKHRCGDVEAAEICARRAELQAEARERHEKVEARKAAKKAAKQSA